MRFSLDRSFSGVVVELPETMTLHGSAWGWNVGTMFTPSKNTRIGLAYRSSMSYDLNGIATIAGIGAATTRSIVRLPDSATIAISQQLNDKWQVLGDITWTNWGRIQNIPLVLLSALGPLPAGSIADVLDLQFKDTWRVGVGANYRWSDKFALKLGTAFDQTPVPDALHRAVFLPDSDRTWLSLGGKYQLAQNDTLDFSYAHLFMKCGDAQRDKGSGAIPGLQGTVSGTYSKQCVDTISIQFTHSF